MNHEQNIAIGIRRALADKEAANQRVAELTVERDMLRAVLARVYLTNDRSTMANDMLDEIGAVLDFVGSEG